MVQIRRGRKGVTFAAVALLVFIVLFVGALAYLTSPVKDNVTTQKNYFEDLNFTLGPHKEWRVGVPVAYDGNLRLSLTSNSSVRVYAKYGQTYLVDKVTAGHQEFAMQVGLSMGIIQVNILNTMNVTVAITGLTCVLTG
jgi:hypothetical protein